MPHLPKIFKRRSSSSIKQAAKTLDEQDAPPVPAIPSYSLPAVVVSSSNISDDISSTYSQPQRPTMNSSVSSVNSKRLTVDTNPKALPPPPPAAEEQMWKAIGDSQAGKNLSKSEKLVNKVSDTVSGAVGVAGSDTGVVGVIKSVIANEEVQAFGKGILDGIPAVMSALETLTEVHPFLKAAYLPFKLIYGQEMKRRENDQKRATLFEKIKDVMMVLLELKDVGKNETRLTPDGSPLLSRLETICNSMKKDIEECYNVLNAQEKRSVAIKFLQASGWNSQLASFAVRFDTRRGELLFALQMRTAAGVDEIKKSVDEMREMFMQMFNACKTPQEREIGMWIQQNGGERTILRSDKKCLALLKKEASMSTSSAHNLQVTAAATTMDDKQRVAALRKEYLEDINKVVADNLESYAKRFQMGMDQLNESLTATITHEGDRIISYLSGGPHKRIKDKILYQVWKDQGWRGSAKTRLLVLALRDYFVERVERSRVGAGHIDSARPPPTPIQPDEDSDDPEVAMDRPLPDGWMTEYLQVKRLRSVQQAFDPDGSGFTTVSEINMFTRSRPKDWSVPKWISYWAVGWQIFATKYVLEIEDIFAQMSLLRKEISIRMPGNARYVGIYIEGVWQHVSALTTALEQYDSAPEWLVDQYEGYIHDQEEVYKRRLENINYDIDTLDTVNLLLGQEHIEHVVLMLLTLILRRHLAKLHLCLKQAISADELDDDVGTVLYVVDTAWIRYIDLYDIFKHEQVNDIEQTFAWFSCGLFSNYLDWREWIDTKHFRTTETITELDPPVPIKSMEPAALQNILQYRGPDAIPPQAQEDDKTENETNANGDAREYDISGRWYGFYWTETSKPWCPMLCLEFYRSVNPDSEDTPDSPKSKKTASTDTKLHFTGETNDYEGDYYTFKGTITIPQTSSESFSIQFEQVGEDGVRSEYTGSLLPFRDIMHGLRKSPEGDGQFLLKRTPMASAMTCRPLEDVVLTPKQLWRYAYDAVIGNIRRTRPTLGYIHDRVIMIKRLAELETAIETRELTDDENAEYSRCKRAFTPTESREIYLLIQWYRRVGKMHFPMTCASCSDPLTKSRVVCLECQSEEDIEETVDFCHKAACVATSSIEGRQDVTHSASHVLLKARHCLLLKDWYILDTKAKNCLDIANDLYKPPSTANEDGETEREDAMKELEESDSKELLDEEWETQASEELGAEDSSDSASEEPETEVSDEEDESDKLKCLFCKDRVVTPCWYCLDCQDHDAFVCDKCEEHVDNMLPWDFQKRYRAEVAKDPLGHNVYHYLIRFGQEDENEENDDKSSPEQLWNKMNELVQQRFLELEGKFGRRMDSMDKRMTDIEEQLSSGLKKIETLLTMLVKPTA